jgi:D-serine dehydratase
MGRAKKKWIQDAIKKPGALHKALGVPMDKNIPEAKLEKAEHSKSHLMRKRANLAETLKHLHHAKGGKMVPPKKMMHQGSSRSR